jgi:hypothetical protein
MCDILRGVLTFVSDYRMGSGLSEYYQSQEGRSLLAYPPGGLYWSAELGVWLFPCERPPEDPMKLARFVACRRQGDYTPYPADVTHDSLVKFHALQAIDRTVNPALYEKPPDWDGKSEGDCEFGLSSELWG